MATMSFRSKADSMQAPGNGGEPTPAPAVEAEQPTLGLVPANAPDGASTNSQLAPFRETEDVTGDWSMRDVKFPYLRIVQKISEDSAVFGAGTILFNGEVKIGGENTPVGMTFLRVHKQYEEKLEAGAERRPVVLETADEVIKAGGSLNPNDKNYFQECAMVQAVIERPDNIDEQGSLLFPYHAPNDKWYAMGLWNVRGTGYGQVGPILYTARHNFLADGLFHGAWEVRTDKRTNTKGSWHVPALRFVGKHTGDMLAFMERLLRSGGGSH